MKKNCKKIPFVSEKGLKHSRIYYEMKLPEIAWKAFFIILSIFLICMIFLIFAPYNYIVKVKAKVRPEKDVISVVSIFSGTIQEKGFRTGDFVQKNQILYRFENEYLEKQIKLNNESYKIYKYDLEKTLKILLFLNDYKDLNYEPNNLSEIDTLLTEIKKYEVEINKAKADYETETKLFPSYTSKNSVDNYRKALNIAELNLENYISVQTANYQRKMQDCKQKLNEIEKNIKDSEHQMQNTFIRSPVSGYIEELYIVNVGESINSERQLAKIVTENENLKAYIYIPASDIAEISTGMKFELSFDKYAFSEYSGITGKITNVPKDSRTDSSGESFFQVTGILNENKLVKRRNKKEVRIIPGMDATCKIPVRTEPIYSFLFEKLEFIK